MHHTYILSQCQTTVKEHFEFWSPRILFWTLIKVAWLCCEDRPRTDTDTSFPLQASQSHTFQSPSSPHRLHGHELDGARRRCPSRRARWRSAAGPCGSWTSPGDPLCLSPRAPHPLGHTSRAAIWEPAPTFSPVPGSLFPLIALHARTGARPGGRRKGGVRQLAGCSSTQGVVSRPNPPPGGGFGSVQIGIRKSKLLVSVRILPPPPRGVGGGAQKGPRPSSPPTSWSWSTCTASSGSRAGACSRRRGPIVSIHTRLVQRRGIKVSPFFFLFRLMRIVIRNEDFKSHSRNSPSGDFF